MRHRSCGVVAFFAENSQRSGDTRPYRASLLRPFIQYPRSLPGGQPDPGPVVVLSCHERAFTTFVASWKMIPVDNESPDEELVGRREALNRFAKYTAPGMLALLAASIEGGPAMAVSAV